MKKLVYALAGAAMAVTVFTGAKAETLLFTFTGDVDASFVLDSDPIPDGQGGADSFYIQNVSVTYFGVTSIQPFVDFYDAAHDGGITVGDGVDAGSPSIIDLYNTVLYSGSPSAPHFDVGVYPLSTVDGGTNDVSLSITGVPEPASWVLMLTGFGLIGAAMRRLRGASRSFT
jgi:PEP-CTERM motif